MHKTISGINCLIHKTISYIHCLFQIDTINNTYLHKETNEDLLFNTENPHLFKLPHKICPNFQAHITLIRDQYFSFLILISIPPLCGGTNSDERFHFPLHCAIIVSRSYTTKHGRRSCRNLSRFKTAF